MIVSQINGGLGNQMFQYATARAMAERLNETLYLDTDFFKKAVPNVDPRVFELNIFPALQFHFLNDDDVQPFFRENSFVNRFKKILGAPYKKVFKETRHGYNPSINNIKTPVLLQGHFQTEKYFFDSRGLIIEQFKFPELRDSDQNLPVYHDILNSLAVSVHVRRGDYVKFKPTNNFHGVCSTDYYKRAIEYFQHVDTNCRFYFFSDEPEWVAENLFENKINGQIVNINTAGESWKDMWLMTQCKHHIIANSSFSWWGAWLNTNPGKKVIAPSRWFQADDPFFEPNDVVPETWIKM